MSLPRVCPWLAWWLVFVPAAGGAPPAKGKLRLDRYGDPLPLPAIARLGTIRFQYEGQLNVLSLSHDGRLVATVNQGRMGPTLGVTETTTGKQFWTFRTNEALVSPPVFSVDGSRLAAGWNHDVFLWEARTGREVRRFRFRDAWVSLVWIAADGKTLAAAGPFGDAVWWDVATGKEQRCWDFFGGKKPAPGKNSGVVADPLHFSPDGRLLTYKISKWRIEKGCIRIYDEVNLATWDTCRKKELWRHRTEFNSLEAFPRSPAGKLFASVRIRPHVSLRSLEMGKEVGRLKGNDRPVGAAFSADGRLLASGHEDFSIRLWDTTTGKQRRRIQLSGKGDYPGEVFERLALSGGGRVVAVARGNRLQLWDTTTGKEMPNLEGHRYPVRGIGFVGPGRVLSVSDARLCFWDRSRWKQTGRLDDWLRNDRFAVLAVSAETGMFLSQEKDRSGRLRELMTGKILRRFPLESKECRGGEFSPDGKVLALLYGDHDQPDIVLHEVSSGKVLGRIVKAATPEFLEFSADGKTLVWWCRDGLVWLADATTGKQVRSIGKKITGERAGSVKHRVAVSADGKRLAIVPRMTREAAEEAGVDGRLRLWDAVTGREILSFVDVPDHVECLALSPDGRMLAAGSLDSPLVHVWETAIGRKRFQLAGHRECVRCLAFSPDGKLLLSGSDDGTVLVWDLRRFPGK